MDLDALRQSLKDIVDRNLFATGEEISDILQNEYNLKRDEITFVTNNLKSEFNVNFTIDDQKFNINVIPQEIVIS